MDNLPRKSLDTKRKAVLQVFKVDAVFCRKNPHKPPVGAKRGKISGGTPSADSLKRLIFLLNNSDDEFTSMITLTFQQLVGQLLTVNQHKAIRKAFLERLRYKYPGIKFVWVREFQKSEIVHWHVFTTCLLYTSPSPRDRG